MSVSPLRVEDLAMRYHTQPVLEGVSFDIPAGSSVAILGPNGAGKSTLLKGIMGLAPLMQGKVSVFGGALTDQRLKVAYVPQRDESDWDFPIQVMDVVLMGRHGHLKFWQRPSSVDRALAKQALQKLDMLPYQNRQISQLSGGQQQRVFLARALVQQADLYLMDEPFAGVDMMTEKAIVGLFEILKQQQKTIVCVHHDLNTVAEYFDWVILINHGLIASGPVETTLTPEIIAKTYGGRIPLGLKLGTQRKGNGRF